MYLSAAAHLSSEFFYTYRTLHITAHSDWDGQLQVPRLNASTGTIRVEHREHRGRTEQGRQW